MGKLIFRIFSCRQEWKLILKNIQYVDRFTSYVHWARLKMLSSEELVGTNKKSRVRQTRLFWNLLTDVRNPYKPQTDSFILLIATDLAKESKKPSRILELSYNLGKECKACMVASQMLCWQLLKKKLLGYIFWISNYSCTAWRKVKPINLDNRPKDLVIPGAGHAHFPGFIRWSI
jgi:hypothetical protein